MPPLCNDGLRWLASLSGDRAASAGREEPDARQGGLHPRRLPQVPAHVADGGARHDLQNPLQGSANIIT